MLYYFLKIIFLLTTLYLLLFRIGPKDTDIIIAYLQETGPVSNACVNRRIQFVRSLRYVKSNLPICHGALKILVNPESDSSNI